MANRNYVKYQEFDCSACGYVWDNQEHDGKTCPDCDGSDDITNVTSETAYIYRGRKIGKNNIPSGNRNSWQYCHYVGYSRTDVAEKIDQFLGGAGALLEALR